MDVREQLTIVGTGVLIAVCLTLFGLFRILVPAMKIKKRLDSLQELPVFMKVAEAQVRISKTQRNVQTIAVLVARAQIAVTEIIEARNRIVAVGRTAALVARAALSIASGLSRATRR